MGITKEKQADELLISSQKREQVQAAAKQAITENKFIGLIEVAPRVGKTKIVIDALNTIEKEINVLVTAPRKEIFNSWKKEAITWKLRDNINITYCWSNGLKKIKDTYHLIIADEVHDYNLKVIAELRRHQLNGTRIFGITGTLDQASEFNLNNILSLTVHYRYSVDQAVRDGIVADYQIFCIGVPLGDDDRYVAAGKEDNPFYQTELEAYRYWDLQYTKAKQQNKWSSLKFLMSKRLNVIYNAKSKLNITQQLVEQVDRCIIFSGRQEIADQIGDTSFHSKSEKDTLDNLKEGKVNKLSVVSMVSMGVTIDNLKIAIFNQLKSGENLAIQQAMRTMNVDKGRKATIIIIYLKETQDEKWMLSALKGFNKDKITYCSINNLSIEDGNTIKCCPD